MITKEYIAGFFDGEGHVSITFNERRGALNPKLCVKITNTYLPILEEIKEIYGGHIQVTKKAKEHYLQCYVLNLTVEQSKTFLIDMFPHLKIKKRQAELALEFAKTVYKRGKSPVTEEQKQIRNRCMEEVRKEKLLSFEVKKEIND